MVNFPCSKYIYKNKDERFIPIQYNAVFRMRLGVPQENVFDAATIMVTLLDIETKNEDTLAIDTIKSNENQS